MEQPDDVAFLDDGMRGFILDVSHLERPVTIRLGDSVTVRGCAGLAYVRPSLREDEA